MEKKKCLLNKGRNRAALALALVLFLLGLSVGGVVAQSQAVVKLVPSLVETDPGQTIDVFVRVEGVRGLYGVQADLHFDPRWLSVRDADPVAEGVQVALTGFLRPDFVVINDVDNEAGTLRLAFTQMAPNPPVEGDGNLATITFESVGRGQADLTWGKVILANADGQKIEARLEGTNVQVGREFPFLGVLGGVAAGIVLVAGAFLFGRRRTVNRQSRLPQPG